MAAAFIFVLAVMGANLTATLFIPFPVFGQVAVGTIIFGITFTQRDRIHHRGRSFVYGTIAVAALGSLFILLGTQFVWGTAWQNWFAARGWDWPAGAVGYLTESGWRVFVASFLAIVIAETVNTEVYQKFIDRSWMGRVARSNGVAIPVDSVIFNLIAFAGVFSLLEWTSIVTGEIVTKFAVGLLYAWLRRPPPVAIPDEAVCPGT